ncbi:MAG: glycosyltransferase family 2 protein [Bacteroidia bacterium]
MSSKKLSIVLPCYNPDKNWVANILIRYNEIAQHLKNYSINVIIVNDGSSQNIDGELSEIEKKLPNCQIISYPANKGKGFAIRKGVEAAFGDYIIYTDIDFPYTNESILEIVNKLDNSDITIGTRGLSYYNNIPAHRIFISKLLKFLIKTLLQIPTDDTQGGLKGMRNEVKQYFLQTEINRYLFDLEFICIASKNKLNIDLIPVVLNENTIVRKMNLKVVSKEMINFFKVYTKMVFS